MDACYAGIIKFLNNEETALCVAAERAFLARTGGGCQVPVGAFAKNDGGEIIIDGVIASLDGKKYFRGQKRMPQEAEENAGTQLAAELLAAGADEILQGIHEIG